mmetsp:Transcript_112941/g.364821  ORF Transcript_112941/g.364821 Transcript_112941/m.364821 type:complete len:262 (-) Transcript_112941:653-1438(-)
MASQPIGYRTVHGVAAAGSLEDRDEEALEKVANIALPQEQRARQKRDERRKPKYDQWRASNFRPGTHLNPVAAPAGGAVVPPQSLGEWFDSGFSEFVGSGSIFGNTPLPEGYEAVIGDTAMPFVFHRANNVWPIRLHLGTVQDARDSVTLYHYLGPKAMRGIAGLLTRGATCARLGATSSRPRSTTRPRPSPMRLPTRTSGASLPSASEAPPRQASAAPAAHGPEAVAVSRLRSSSLQNSHRLKTCSSTASARSIGPQPDG